MGTAKYNSELYEQTKALINMALPMEWKIAFIDDVLDMNEEYLVRKIADLLHVPHTAFIMAKIRVGPKRKLSCD